MTLRIQLSGAITGMRELNKPAFDAAAALLTSKGYEVICPHELCKGLPEGSPHSAYMDVCLTSMLGIQALYMLPGWEDSKGACMEMAEAKRSGTTVWFGR